ncbi:MULTISPECIES: NAD(P)/FAD-dependent oxidoreductase [Bosea]|uniref:NAD(P)/FAD-dependent oxidoreductase n=1 Tax=Bosea TaxID=85413 RepID=UPI00215030A3|nr:MULTISPECIES: NAD(P)/FAD-dependent oxidoreductase [Bosea]MCR4522616.1 NAD(P)/FAD-dependent oxidoreductase [Bosea sp. 47.2.35]MDR6827123.1 NADH dehydrogenase [Bosea robiniae]MDR6893833.1 NADH dehydrogenase [Bosea sp. BE109]MDR7136467.1 NADH dehydrogenase [Bosea sp. BE168]MDR7173166.1 NADH dehydrogenase [Bosea sp. BE271]
MTAPAEHHVVIVGAGFGGLEAARNLADVPVRITMIDQRNHHLFQPLLYQVATASLPTSEIAWPIRFLLRGHKNVTTLLGTVIGVDRTNRQVLLEGERPIGFDTLILATGARHAYFGHDEWEPYAPGVKTLEDATRIRRRILSAFEQAEWETDPERRAQWLTFVIIGAGPTGVELAGTIAELAHDTLRGDFRNIDTRSARVILVEAGPRILAGFSEDLSAYAERALNRLGVEVRLGQPVSECRADGIVLGGELLPARTTLWAAGVAASPAAEWLEASADRAGRLRVEPDLTVPGEPDIFVIGDTAFVAGADGKPVPGIAPAAKQQGRYVADLVKARLGGKPAPPPFAYRNAGNLATIGKRAAIVDFGWIKLRGRLAWWIWGIAHIFFLIGLRNRLAVALNWLWIYVSGHRSARLITQRDPAGSREPR